MGILDDLKNQSNIQKAGEASETQRQADLLKFYQENLHPKMLQLYSFLNEFSEHLNYIKTQTSISYPIKYDGSAQSFDQYDYKVTIDSATEVKEINLRFACHLKEPLIVELENSESILRFSDLLHSYKIDFDRTDNKDKDYQLISAKFKVNGPVNVNVILQGDVESSSIHLILKNFDKPGFVKHTYKERHITEEFIDGLGRFILRQHPMFLKLDIKDGHKDEIRKKIKADLALREKELKESEDLLNIEQQKEDEKKSWKNLFKKMD
ncbi:MAG: hypothetical protein QM484_05930 [Woeseiaceae bacterium]